MALDGSLDLLSLVHSFVNMYDMNLLIYRYYDIILSINKFTCSYFLAASLYLSLFSFPKHF